MKESKFDIEWSKLGEDDVEGARELCVNEWFLPVAKQILKDDEKCQSVVVSVSSYYNDQADNECHVKFIRHSSPFSTWEDLMDPEKNSFIVEDWEMNECLYRACNSETQRRVFDGSYGPYVGNEDLFIQAILPFCREGYTEGDIREYAPFLTVERDGDDFKIRKIFEIVQVWK